MSGVRLEALVKRFGATEAVRGVSLDIADGEFVVFVGPSGCGKTTTLNMIAGLETPSSGEVYIGTERVTDWEPRDRNLGMVFQSLALFPHMTRLRQHRLPLANQEGAGGDRRGARSGGGRHGEGRSSPGPETVDALRRERPSAWRWRAPSSSSPPSS